MNYVTLKTSCWYYNSIEWNKAPYGAGDTLFFIIKDILGPKIVLKLQN